MQDFIQNISRYPRYMISLIAGVFWNFFEPMVPMLRRPITAIALIGALISSFIFLTLTLKAMLGLPV